jgi:hypothetical protein
MAKINLNNYQSSTFRGTKLVKERKTAILCETNRPGTTIVTMDPKGAASSVFGVSGGTLKLVLASAWQKVAAPQIGGFVTKMNLQKNFRLQNIQSR